jgi:hypothetical protein
MSPSKECELCLGASLTTRYFENDECWIADCLICRVPMVVLRAHDAAPGDSERAALVANLTPIADEFHAGRGWYYDDHMRRIPDHYHGHARAR